jgi:phage N-6-adenine-methyltransferase
MPKKVTVQDWLNMGRNERTDEEKQIVETPDALYAVANEEFNFTLDAAALPENTKHPNFISPEEDSIAADWVKRSNGGAVWLNPPYGNFIGTFMEKAYKESQRGITVVVLTFVRSDTEWWDEWVGNKAHEVRNIVGRVKFVGKDNGGFFPSCLIIYRGNEPFTGTKLIPWRWRLTQSRKGKKNVTTQDL